MAALSVDAVDPAVVARFWCEVLGWSIVEEDIEDAVGIGIGPADGSWPTIDVLKVPEKKAVKNRLHLDIRADGVSTEDELARLLDLGAYRVDVGQRSDVPWVVLADPEALPDM